MCEHVNNVSRANLEYLAQWKKTFREKNCGRNDEEIQWLRELALRNPQNGIPLKRTRSIEIVADWRPNDRYPRGDVLVYTETGEARWVPYDYEIESDSKLPWVITNVGPSAHADRQLSVYVRYANCPSLQLQCAECVMNKFSDVITPSKRRKCVT